MSKHQSLWYSSYCWLAVLLSTSVDYEVQILVTHVTTVTSLVILQEIILQMMLMAMAKEAAEKEHPLGYLGLMFQ
jgi:hypothetical protein